VQQGGNQGLRVEVPAGQDFGDGQRMRDVGCAALAKLAFMGARGILISALEGLLIRSLR
jgi:hypothetical protein